jgi:hypothetical protein
MNDTFCPFPFVQLALKQWDPRQGILDATPCCNQINEKMNPMEWDKNFRISNLSVEEIFNHDKMKELRSALLSGEKHKSCNVCWKMEEETGVSYRKYAIDAVEKMNLDVNIDSPSLQMVDLSTGDNCNLRCRMCNPGVSNLLRKDLKEFNRLEIDTTEFLNWDTTSYKLTNSENIELHSPDVNHEQFLSLLNSLSSIKIIKAAGGEPFISKSFLYLLDYAIEHNYAKNITLEITTNATKFNNSIMEKLNQFKSVKPTFSIDGIEKTYNYIRYPFNFSKLESSIQNFITRTENCSQINSNFVLQAYNYENINDYINWHEKITNQYLNKIDLWTIEMDLVHPYDRPLDIKWLPLTLLKKQYNLIKESQGEVTDNLYVNSDKIIGYIENIIRNYTDNELRMQKQKNLKKEILAFDKVRNQNYIDYSSNEFTKFLESVVIDE